MTAGRHQIPDPPPGRFGALRRTLGRVSLLVYSLGCGLLVACLVAVVAESSYLHFRSVPRERAVVVGQVDGSGSRMCGKSPSPPVLTTYRVADPRPGFAEQFVVSECPGDSTPGDEVVVARKDPWAAAEVAPLDGQLHVLGTALEVGALFSAAVAGWELFRRWRS